MIFDFFFAYVTVRGGWKPQKCINGYRLDCDVFGVTVLYSITRFTYSTLLAVQHCTVTVTTVLTVTDLKGRFIKDSYYSTAMDCTVPCRKDVC
jgi:hypothetical protein